MRNLARKLPPAAFLSIVVLAAGCNPAVTPLPPAEEIIRALSYAVLMPETTCEQLREDYGLTDLPLVDTPDQIDIPYEEHYVTAPDGAELRIWYLPVESARGLVIVCSGNSGPMACYLFTAKLLVEANWSCVMFDYEGFGGSTGTADLRTLRPDLQTVLDWTLAETPTDRVSLFGISLGSIPAVAVAIDNPDSVNAVVLDSPIALGEAIDRFDFLIQGQSRQVVAVLEPWLLTENTIAGMLQPMLVYMHGDDVVTPPRQVAVLLERAVADTELVYFSGLGHAAGQFLRTDEYRAHLVSFLAEAWWP